MAHHATVGADPDVLRAGRGRDGEDLRRGQPLLCVETDRDVLFWQVFDQTCIACAAPDEFAPFGFVRDLQCEDISRRQDLPYLLALAQGEPAARADPNAVWRNCQGAHSSFFGESLLRPGERRKLRLTAVGRSQLVMKTVRRAEALEQVRRVGDSPPT